MRIRILLIIFFFSFLQLSAQVLSVFNPDDSGLPLMKAKFYSFDDNGKQLTGFNKNDFKIFENGLECEIIDVKCENTGEKLNTSVALSIDISGSMFGEPIILGKNTAKNLIKYLEMPPSEFAIQTSDESPDILQDFTHDKQLLEDKINSITIQGDNNFLKQLLDDEKGVLNVAKRGKYKNKIAVIFTDAYNEGLDENSINRCIDTCLKYDIRFYAIIYTMAGTEKFGSKANFQKIADLTGGALFDGIVNEEASKNLGIFLSGDITGAKSCSIEWMRKYGCEDSINAEFTLIPYNFKRSITYKVKNSKKPGILYNPSGIIKFDNISPPQFLIKEVEITAYNADIQINSITATNDEFDILNWDGVKPPFVLRSGEKRKLTVRYMPINEGNSFCLLTLNTDACEGNKFYAMAGYNVERPLKDTLKITYPNGGEELIAGTEADITWEGTASEDTVQIDYSIDDGQNWKTLTLSAKNFKYTWKDIPKPVSNNCLIRISTDYFSPGVKWNKNYGNFRDNIVTSFIEPYDGGYLLSGHSSTGLGDKSINLGETDFWLVRTDNYGNLVWEQSYGGKYMDMAFSAVNTLDSGFIITGSSNSMDQHVSNNYGQFDCWILKIDKQGTIEWEKSLGGTKDESGYSIIQTSDSGYVVTGVSDSKSGNFYNNYGENDCFVFKLDNKGNTSWYSIIGGSKDDTGNSLVETDDGGFIVAGSTYSNDGFVNGNKGQSDLWLIKYNNWGSIVWQKLYGGSKDDKANVIIKTADGGYLVGGTTSSNDGDIIKNNGYYDCWLLKLNNEGEIEWQKTFGGAFADNLISIDETNDYGYLIAAKSNSEEHDLSNNYGGTDIWIFKINLLGDIEWEKSYGGSKDEEVAGIFQTNTNSIILAGSSESNDNDVSNNKGNYDYLMLELLPDIKIPQEDTSDAVFTILAPNAEAKDIDMNRVQVSTIKDSTIKEFLKNTGSYPNRIDNIYIKGRNFNEFSVNADFPFTLGVGESKDIEFSFFPESYGEKNAEVVIYSQADTIIQTIKGFGVEPFITSAVDTVDFGNVIVNESKDTLLQALIQNIGELPAVIDSIYLFESDNDQFILTVGIYPVILEPGETHTVELRYSPVQTGISEGIIKFNYNGSLSPLTVYLRANSNRMKPNIIFQFPDTLVNVDDKICVPLIAKLADEDYYDMYEIDYNISFSLPYDVLHADINYERIEGNNQLFTFSGNINLTKEPKELFELCGRVLLSDDIINPIKINGYTLSEGLNAEIIDGSIRIDSSNICEYSIRTIRGFQELSVSIQPNPVTEMIDLEIYAEKDVPLRIHLYDLNGTLIYSVKENSKGNNKVIIEASSLSNGIYQLVVQTPEEVKVEKVGIVR